MIPPAMNEGSNLNASLPTLLLLIFFILAILVGVKGYPSMSLIYVSLVTDDIEQLFMFLLAVHLFSFKYLPLSPFLKWRFFVVMIAPNIFWI